MRASALERRGLALDLFLARGIDLESLQVMPQRLGGLARQDGGFADEIRGLFEARIGLRGAAQRRGRLGQQIMRARVVVFVDGRERRARRGSEPASSGDALLFREELLDGAHGGDLALELGQLVAQQVEAGVAVLDRRRQRLMLEPAGAQALVDFRDGGGEARVGQALIEKLALGAALDQVLIFLLAVNLDQKFRQLAQRLERDELTVDVGTRASVRADHATYDDLAVVVHRLRIQPGARAGGEPREACRNLRSLGAVAHDVAGAAAAGDEHQGVHHDGLAGPGLAGQREESRAELELRLVHDHQIAQFQVSQHE